MHKVLIRCPLTESDQERLRAAGNEVIIGTDDWTNEILDCDAFMVGLDRVTRETMVASQNLKIVSKYGIGTDNIDKAAATELGIVVTNTPGASKIAVGELAIGLMFALRRYIPLHNGWVKTGNWDHLMGTEVVGTTMGIVGLGNIGKEVVTRAKGLGMKVMASDPYWDEAYARQYEVERASLPELFSKADVITLHIPATPETVGMIGERELAMMKPDAILINTARGELVDQDALYQALKSKRLGGAALDVWPKEPPTGNPLLELDSVIATPHTGGETVESRPRLSGMCTDNALDLLGGGKPKHVVNLAVYDGTLRS